jgi:hypothetical protein
MIEMCGATGAAEPHANGRDELMTPYEEIREKLGLGEGLSDADLIVGLLNVFRGIAIGAQNPMEMALGSCGIPLPPLIGRSFPPR